MPSGLPTISNAVAQALKATGCSGVADMAGELLHARTRLVECEARLSAAERPAPTWQPIESAPKGRRPLIFWLEWHPNVSASYEAEHVWFGRHSEWDQLKIATHWMDPDKLPAPPGPVAPEEKP